MSSTEYKNDYIIMIGWDETEEVNRDQLVIYFQPSSTNHHPTQIREIRRTMNNNNKNEKNLSGSSNFK